APLTQIVNPNRLRWHLAMTFPLCDINDLEGLLWTHVSLLSLCAILIIASFNSQFRNPAPYGRFADPAKAKAWGFPIPQRIGHMVSDALPGIPLCLAVYLLYSGLLPRYGSFSEVRAVNVVLLCGWLLHYLYRGVVHPLIMPYSSKTVAVGITLAGIFPNALFAYLIAAQLACSRYPDNWASQPRFIIGVVLYAVGTAVNRWADLKLRAGRLALQRRRHRGNKDRKSSSGSSKMAEQEQQHKQQLISGGGGGGAEVAGGGAGAAEGEKEEAEGGDVRSQYFIPRGGLFEFVSCPNYLGELLQWGGYALAVWSWSALGWLLFCTSTFLPRSLGNHRWYQTHFGSEYPPNRKALIPFVL
ncbi:hypothetical protein Agub_g5601, partial [Astrephomene gubernaculifera]